MVVNRKPSEQPAVDGPTYSSRFLQKKHYRQALHRVTYEINPGDTLYQLLVDQGIDPGEVEQLATASRPYVDLRSLRAGEELQLVFASRSRRLEKLRYQDTEGRRLTLGRTPWGWVASNSTREAVVTTAVARGTIKDSLYRSAVEAGIDFELAMGLADIFGWDIDFFVDLRADDRYAFLYEKKYEEGDFIGNGRILLARFENAGTLHQAYYFKVPGEEPGYYDAEGRALRKQFLKSPLRYTRISSGFSRRRLHPILKIYRPHLGIDYAAPVGTPVVAIGEGRVTRKGWVNGYGRLIEIRHNHRYLSSYGHLSRYAANLRQGSNVKQGQVIGYVGASGLATGPHLDFRFKMDGRYVNPLDIRFPAARSVPREYLPAFRERMAMLEEKFMQTLARMKDMEAVDTASVVLADQAG